MAIKIGKGATRALGFQLRVQKLNIHHSRAKVSLAAIPIAPFFEPHAAFLGSIKDHKITTKCNKSLKRVLRQVDWDKSKLKPLKDLLRAKLVEGRRHPDRLIAILKTTLSHDCTPNFKLKFSPSNHSISPDALTVSVLPQDVQSLNFQLIPTEIKVGNQHRKIRIDAILSPGFTNEARFTGIINHHKQTFSFNNDLKKVLADIGWQESDLKPLEDFLGKILKKGDRDLDFIIGILATFLKDKKIAPNFVVNKPTPP